MTYRELPDIYTLRKLLKYDEAAGILLWQPRPLEMFATEGAAKAWNTRYAGRVAGGKTNEGYISIGILGISYMAHRLVWTMANNRAPEGEIDHINGNKADNRVENLRVVTTQENARNTKKQKNNSTGQTGVYWDKSCSKYVAIIGIDNKLKNLGRFQTASEACAARKAAEAAYGFSCRHGS